jgi:hypothetical protein
VLVVLLLHNQCALTMHTNNMCEAGCDRLCKQFSYIRLFLNLIANLPKIIHATAQPMHCFVLFHFFFFIVIVGYWDLN